MVDLVVDLVHNNWYSMSLSCTTHVCVFFFIYMLHPYARSMPRDNPLTTPQVHALCAAPSAAASQPVNTTRCFTMLDEHHALRIALLRPTTPLFHNPAATAAVTTAALPMQRALDRMHQRCQRAAAAAGFDGVARSHQQLLAALELTADKVDVLRVLRQLHVASVRVEVATAEVDAVRDEVAEAAAGRADESGVRGRHVIEGLAREARGLRGRMRYLDHQRGALLHGAVVELDNNADIHINHGDDVTNTTNNTTTNSTKTSLEMRQGEYASLLAKDMARAQTGIAAALQFDTACMAAHPHHHDDHAHHASTITCPVCLEHIHLELTMFPCGHCFCQRCAEHLALQCAVCRHRARNAQQLFRVTLSEGMSASRQQDPTFWGGAAVDATAVIGSWGTKIEALLRRVLRLRAEAPEQKSLIFSQFPEALKLVGRALHVNGVGHVMLSGTRKACRTIIQQFENQPDVRVFLLPMRTAAAGLTLTRANHVFLLEPAVDPAVEQQAVGRVHRIGQTRPVVVYRLLVENTVEERILGVNEGRGGLFGRRDDDDARAVEDDTIDGLVQRLFDAQGVS